MFLIHLKKIAFIFILGSILASNLFLLSCEKEYSNESNGFSVEPPDLSTKVNSSVSGFVTDENNEAIANATITVGNKNTITDKYGFFEVSDVQVIKEAGLVTVDYFGYFKGIKTYMATEGKSAFFRIKLIPKVNTGSFSVANGGIVTLNSGLMISFPADAVINESTNEAYTGLVNVASHWIDPTDNELYLSMPGDLRGLDSTGAMKILTTYGMAAVALTGATGELLQIAPGKKATITFPLPTGITSGAPANIPLWYFDESNGLWKEEGVAMKSGNNYIGEVSHFSYWNCDVPANFVRFDCTITNTKGIPVTNAFVKISVAGNPQKAGYGYTDSSGFTSGAVPNNTSLLLEVFAEYNCLSGLYAKNFTTTSSNISLGKIIIPATNSATITGNVNNCSNAPVTNGYIIMRKDNFNFYQPLSNTGTFNFTTALCSNNTIATFIAEDKTALKASDVISASLNAGTNSIGTLMACLFSTQQYLNYSINGTNYSFTAPADSILQYAKPQNTLPSIIVTAANLNSNTQSATIGFLQTGIAVNSSQNLQSFICPQISANSTIVTPIAVKITEYGAVGQFMAGNFTGTITGPAPGNISYVTTCTFRVRRNQ